MNRSIRWRRLDVPGREVCALASVAGGWQLSGAAVFLERDRPCALTYRVVCDPRWRTVSAEVHGQAGPREVEVALTAQKGRWRLNDVEQPAVAGSLDLDLGFSPATNLLPIRRLALAVGEQAPVRAAWLPFPRMTLEPLEQIYRREGPAAYRYESAGGRFACTLEVDPAGLILHYPGLWLAE